MFSLKQSGPGGGFTGVAGMWNAWNMVMSIAQIVLIVMAALVSGFALATLYDEFMTVICQSRSGTRELTQTGDSSLRPRSVNWLALTALISALLICFVWM
jgi:hypothetical protein